MIELSPIWNEEAITLFFTLGKHKFRLGSYGRSGEGFKVFNLKVETSEKDKLYATADEARQHLESLLPSGKPVWWTDGYLRKDSYVLGYVRKNAIFEKFNAYIFSASNTMCNGYMEGFPSVSEARKFIESELLGQNDEKET